MNSVENPNFQRGLISKRNSQKNSCDSRIVQSFNSFRACIAHTTENSLENANCFTFNSRKPSQKIKEIYSPGGFLRSALNEKVFLEELFISTCGCSFDKGFLDCRLTNKTQIKKCAKKLEEEACQRSHWLDLTEKFSKGFQIKSPGA